MSSNNRNFSPQGVGKQKFFLIEWILKPKSVIPFPTTLLTSKWTRKIDGPENIVDMEHKYYRLSILRLD